MSDEVRRHGHVKISRKVFVQDRWWLEPRVFSRWEAWVDMIQMSAWKARVRMVAGESVTLARGEVFASERFLAQRWKWSTKKVRGWLAMCQAAGSIRKQEEKHRGTLYLLVNYDTYQSSAPEKEAQEEPEKKRRGSAEEANKKQLSSEAGKAILKDVAPRGASWLTPILDVWVAELGGTCPPPGRVGRALSPLYPGHAPEAIAARLRVYLRQSNGKASIEHFAQTFGKWQPGTDPDSQLSAFAGPPESAFRHPLPGGAP